MKKENEVIMNTDLQQALKGFVPTIGNTDDLRIVNDLTKLHKKLSSIDNKVFREAEKKRGVSQMTSKMREIQSDERYLTQRIIKRNLDF